jgi:3',5'-cyclic AMP phosphodiesterase CpdA
MVAPREREVTRDVARPGRSSVRVALFAALWVTLDSGAASADMRLTKGPYVTGVFDTGADVRFELDGAAPARVTIAREADPTTGLQTFDSPDQSGLHVARISGLQAATRYEYSVRVGSLVLGDGHFSTAPAEGSTSPVTFIVYGDDRTDPIAHSAVAHAMLQVPSDFIVNTGDTVEDGGDADAWQTFFGVEASLLRDRPIFVSVGNHELVSDFAGTNFARYFGFPDGAGQSKLYGTARLGLLRFFFLNGTHGWEFGEERDWLVRELTKADAEPGVVWRVVVVHHGPWSSGPHGPNARLVDAHIPELLASHHVDLLLSGHDHIYERGSSGGLKYLVSGGGGAPLYRIDRLQATSLKAEAAYHFVQITASSSSLKVLARRVDGTVLDRCGFDKGRAWDCDSPRVEGPPPVAVSVAATSRAPSARCSCESGSSSVDRSALSSAALLVALVGLRRVFRTVGAGLSW